ncbi:hypothetical protein LTR37_019359 [Vermiconidia calcicola]|uniref:Uncharacterized protein n=1 Tax=Vermiconidia calcicola TaxID=1690605 RepID=A0ACC3MEC0_9PEZI|nr:hypothetical protein LTR37_019359 [Vermiconidia calcicola]
MSRSYHVTRGSPSQTTTGKAHITSLHGPARQKVFSKKNIVEYFELHAGGFDPKRWLSGLESPQEVPAGVTSISALGAGSDHAPDNLGRKPSNTDDVDYDSFKIALATIPRDSHITLIIGEPWVTGH